MEHLAFRPIIATLPFELDQHSPKQHVHSFFTDITSGVRVCTGCGLVDDESPVFPPSYPSPITETLGLPVYSRKESNKPPSYCLLRALKQNQMRPWIERKRDIGVYEIRRIGSQGNYPAKVQDRAIYLFK